VAYVGNRSASSRRRLAGAAGLAAAVTVFGGKVVHARPPAP
jgi:hypothetical protein